MPDWHWKEEEIDNEDVVGTYQIAQQVSRECFVFLIWNLQRREKREQLWRNPPSREKRNPPCSRNTKKFFFETKHKLIIQIIMIKKIYNGTLQ